jgi:arginyl-tRNA synthetase
MILPVHAQLRQDIRAALTRAFGLAEADQPAIVIEVPPRRSLGDLAVPVAFELARRLRKAPKVIAQELAAALGTPPGASRIEAAPNGYLNVYLAREDFARAWLKPVDATASPTGEKVIVEHTAINPNKAAHIGHLRNSALGDTLVRLSGSRVRHGRGPELHRRHRRPGGRRCRRVHVARGKRPRRRPRDRRRFGPAIRLLLLGSVRAR